MVFTKRLREGVRRGEITCSVRFWMRPHVRVGAIPDGRRRDRDRFDRADRVPGHYAGIGTRVRIFGCAGFAEGGEARSKREDLFGAIPLRAAAGQTGCKAEDVVR